MSTFSTAFVVLCVALSSVSSTARSSHDPCWDVAQVHGPAPPARPRVCLDTNSYVTCEAAPPGSRNQFVTPRLASATRCPRRQLCYGGDRPSGPCADEPRTPCAAVGSFQLQAGNCKMFYVCKTSAYGFTKYISACAYGFEFNSNTSSCTTTASAGCSAPATTSNNTNSSTTEISGSSTPEPTPSRTTRVSATSASTSVATTVSTTTNAATTNKTTCAPTTSTTTNGPTNISTTPFSITTNAPTVMNTTTNDLTTISTTANAINITMTETTSTAPTVISTTSSSTPTNAPAIPGPNPFECRRRLTCELLGCYSLQ